MRPSALLMTSIVGLTFILLGAGCSSDGFDPSEDWSGTIDTLASGEIIVRNTDQPLWSAEESWRVVEEIRIGLDTSDSAILFGEIRSFDVDSKGRVFALDAQTLEIQVFNTDGNHFQTIGGKGAGPGEFESASAVDLSHNGEIWVMDMLRGRLKILDAFGNYLRTEAIGSFGWSVWPYPGGFDLVGRYNALIRTSREEGRTELLARFDQSLTPLDTIPVPERSDIEYFQHETETGGTLRILVPYQGDITWCFAPNGNLWTLLTDKYELAEITGNGKTLRRVTKEFDPIPVTAEDRAELARDLELFTEQGVKIDWSKIPKNRPVVTDIFCDDMANLWVKRDSQDSDEEEDEGSVYDLFDPDGRFLGMLQLPFDLHSHPIVRNELLFGITEDESGAPNIVRARIEKP